MLKIGNTDVKGLYLGNTEIVKAYMGSDLVFQKIKIFTITATIDPAGSGTVTGAGQYQEGETVTLTANMNDGYTFNGWQENGVVVSIENPYSFETTQDRSFTALFVEAPQYEPGVDWWETALNSLFKSITSITYGNGMFVAVGTVSKYYNVGYSRDGITWKYGSLPYNKYGNNWRSVTYGNGKFVAVKSSSDDVAYSEDGVTWKTARGESAFWQSVTYGNGKFVAVAGGSGSIEYSEDGIRWSYANNPDVHNLMDVTYGNGLYVATAPFGVIYSNDGINWNYVELFNPGSSAYTYITYANGMFLRVQRECGRFHYSTDGITWNSYLHHLQNDDFSGITYGDGKFVIITEESGVAFYSTDGMAWTKVTLPSANMWCDIAYGNRTFVAISGATSGATAIYSRPSGPP